MSSTRKTAVYQALLDLSASLTLASDDHIYGWSADFLAEQSGFSRSNVSRELNVLHKEQKIIKINGRPVYFISAEKNLLEKPIDKFFLIIKKNFITIFVLSLKINQQP